MSSENIAQFKHKCLLITITRDDYDLYHQVRSAWRINIERAREYPYVMAVQGGVIRDVYEPTEWRQATSANFPEYADRGDYPERCGFVGKLATDDIRLQYIGKKVPDEYRGQFPVRYIDI